MHDMWCGTPSHNIRHYTEVLVQNLTVLIIDLLSPLFCHARTCVVTSKEVVEDSWPNHCSHHVQYSTPIQVDKCSAAYVSVRARVVPAIDPVKSTTIQFEFRYSDYCTILHRQRHFAASFKPASGKPNASQERNKWNMESEVKLVTTFYSPSNVILPLECNAQIGT